VDAIAGKAGVAVSTAHAAFEYKGAIVRKTSDVTHKSSITFQRSNLLPGRVLPPI
jgi:hypothetical protein